MKHESFLGSTILLLSLGWLSVAAEELAGETTQLWKAGCRRRASPTHVRWTRLGNCRWQPADDRGVPSRRPAGERDHHGPGLAAATRIAAPATGARSRPFPRRPMARVCARRQCFRAFDQQRRRNPTQPRRCAGQPLRLVAVVAGFERADRVPRRTGRAQRSLFDRVVAARRRPGEIAHAQLRITRRQVSGLRTEHVSCCRLEADKAGCRTN